MTFNVLYNALESAYQTALIAVYNADIPGDLRNDEIDALRHGLDGAMDSEQIEAFTRQCEAVTAQYTPMRSHKKVA